MNKILTGLVIASLALVAIVRPTSAAVSTITVLPSDMATSLVDVVNNPTSWFFYNDENDTIDNSLGSFVVGPDTTPLGQGSVQISVTGTQRRNLATYQFKGVPLADITELAFSTYNPSAGNGGSANRSGYLNFNVDFNGTDTWQRRLVFVPSDNGTVMQDTWQEWDAINDGNALWRYSGAVWPNTATPGSTPKTWNQILSEYPGVKTRTSDSWLGVRIGEPYANGYTENVDAFKFGVNGDTKVFDFEPSIKPTSKDQCKKDGWMTFNDPSFKNQGDCVSYMVSKGKNK